MKRSSVKRKQVSPEANVSRLRVQWNDGVSYWSMKAPGQISEQSEIKVSVIPTVLCNASYQYFGDTCVWVYWMIVITSWVGSISRVNWKEKDIYTRWPITGIETASSKTPTGPKWVGYAHAKCHSWLLLHAWITHSHGVNE